MELVPIVKSVLLFVSIAFVVVLIVSYISSKFKKPSKPKPIPPLEKKIIPNNGKTTTKSSTNADSETKDKIVTKSSGTGEKPSVKTKTAENGITGDRKISTGESKRDNTGSRKRSEKKIKTNRSHSKIKQPNRKLTRESRFEIIKDLKRARKRRDSNGNFSDEFR